MQFPPSASGGSSAQGSSTLGASNPTFETPATQNSPASAARTGQAHSGLQHRRSRQRPLPSVELEAVVSCTSDGLVVILRQARPAIPPAHPPLALSSWEFENGLFAAPWAQQPVRPHVPPEMLYTFRAPLLPQYMPLRENVKAAGGPPIEHLMSSIRDVAVFAWALVGINGKLALYSHGHARGEAAPQELSIWDPVAPSTGYRPPHNQAAAGAPQSLGARHDYTTAAASSNRDLPLPVFGMPGYLKTSLMYSYQSSGHGYMPTPQYRQQDAVSGHVGQASGLEPWRTEQHAQPRASFPVASTESPNRSESPRAHDGGRN